MSTRTRQRAPRAKCRLPVLLPLQVHAAVLRLTRSRHVLAADVAYIYIEGSLLLARLGPRRMADARGLVRSPCCSLVPLLARSARPAARLESGRAGVRLLTGVDPRTPERIKRRGGGARAVLRSPLPRPPPPCQRGSSSDMLVAAALLLLAASANAAWVRPEPRFPAPSGMSPCACASSCPSPRHSPLLLSGLALTAPRPLFASYQTSARPSPTGAPRRQPG